MRRIALIAALLATGMLALFGQAASGDGDEYKVRAIFDNGGFLVPGEEVRVAGATVGSVSSVEVTLPGEAVHRDGSPDPGKAVVVMQIDEAGFQDFRQDASCLIRPQSLLGEKFVDCQPTVPRAPGSAPPPALDEVPDGEPGEGQRFLPLEGNGKAVDIDLINNIMREPYADRFRLIFNDLGAGFAARGDDLAAIIRRADPALRETNRVLAELARQNKQLSQLARDGDTVLQPWARERRATAQFINNAQVAAEATAERSRDLEAGFQRFPEALRELRLTMVKLRQFSDQAAPVFAEFRAGGEAIARSTRALGPFANATEPALTSLGDAARVGRQPVIDADPLLRDIRDLAKESTPGAKVLTRLLTSLRETGFYRQFTTFLYNTTGGINGYDQFGHFLRAALQVTPCTDLYTFDFGCSSKWRGDAGKAPFSPADLQRWAQKLQKAGSEEASGSSGRQSAPGTPLDAAGDPVGGAGAPPASRSGGGRQPSIGAARALLDTVIGRQGSSQEAGP